jgi:hypothetical protein
VYSSIASKKPAEKEFNTFADSDMADNSASFENGFGLDDEQRLIEERRKRRLAILQKYQSVDDVTSKTPGKMKNCLLTLLYLIPLI